MKPDLCTLQGWEDLTAFFSEVSQGQRRQRLAVFDYDGTLIPLENALGAARLSLKMSESLAYLREKWTLILLTGRSIADMKQRLSGPQFAIFDHVIGNHGIENPFSDPSLLITYLEKMTSIRPFFDRELARDLYSGFQLEDKVFSWTLHFPVNLSEEAGQRKIKDLVLGQELRLVYGRGLVNLIPEGAASKGDALKLILDKISGAKALFVGDDWTDENVFSLRDPRIFTVRVGDFEETAASYKVENQERVFDLVAQLAKI